MTVSSVCEVFGAERVGRGVDLLGGGSRSAEGHRGGEGGLGAAGRSNGGRSGVLPPVAASSRRSRRAVVVVVEGVASRKRERRGGSESELLHAILQDFRFRDRAAHTFALSSVKAPRRVKPAEPPQWKVSVRSSLGPVFESDARTGARVGWNPCTDSGRGTWNITVPPDEVTAENGVAAHTTGAHPRVVIAVERQRAPSLPSFSRSSPYTSCGAKAGWLS